MMKAGLQAAVQSATTAPRQGNIQMIDSITT
jgi:hypothetical protein